LSNIWIVGKVEDDKLMLEDLGLYHNLVHELNGKFIQLQIVEREFSKTEAQLNTYYGIIIGKYIMGHEDFGGWTKEEIDTYLGSMFRIEFVSVKDPNTDSKEVKEQIIRVSRMKRRAMTVFMEDVIRYLAESHDIKVEINAEEG